MSRWRFWGLGICVLVGAAACGSDATLLRVEIAAPGVTVASLSLSLTWSGHATTTAMIPTSGGRPTLPGSVLVELPDVSTEITVGLSADVGAAAPLTTQGMVQSRAHHEVDLLLTLGGAGPDAGVDGGVADLSVEDLAPSRDLDVATPLVQLGPLTDGTASLTGSLDKPSTAGTLLVFTMTFDKNADPVGPAGWTRLSGFSTANDAEIWYLANNPGGITTATATLSGADVSVGQISEWRGVSTLDQGSWCWQDTPTTSRSCTSSPTTRGGELGLSCFSQYLPSPTPAPISPGAEWTVLGDDTSAARRLHYQFSYQAPLPSAAPVYEEANSPVAAPWAGAVGSFY